MKINDVTPQQLREFIGNHHEKAYALIDVRQPGEYQQGHIPGARLLPLPELIQTMENLPTDKRLVFYCHSGGRSLAAASMVADEGIGKGDLINLDGGMLAWDGGIVSDYPNVELFDGQATSFEMLNTAMNLEKGALNFYTHISVQYSDRPWVKVFMNLAKAEMGHARTVYHFWREVAPDKGDFDTVFGALSGQVLEGGMQLSTAVAKLSEIKNRVCLNLIETALKIEYAAFDLYHTMADRASEPEAREAFITIAQAEKAHMQALAKAIGGCS